MNTTFNIWAILLSLGAVQGFFLIPILLTQKTGRRTANILLAVLVFDLALIHSLHALQYFQLNIIHFLVRIEGLLWLTLPPVFYTYVRVLTGRKVRRWINILHLIPLLLNTIPIVHELLFPISFSQAAYKSYLSFNPASGLSIISFLFTYQFLVLAILYSGLSTFELFNYEKTYKQNVSNSKIYYLEWLQRVLLVFIIYLIYEIAISLYMIVYGSLTVDFINMSICFLSSFFYVIVYTAIRNPTMLFPVISVNEDKYQRSTMSEESLHLNRKKLEQLMAEKKPYLNNELKLQDLARMSDMSTHHLSQLLNQDFNRTFYDFINEHRVEEVCFRLKDPKNDEFTILAIALDVGFNSKTTFNRIFKKHMNMSPSDYLKNSRA